MKLETLYAREDGSKPSALHARSVHITNEWESLDERSGAYGAQFAANFVPTYQQQFEPNPQYTNMRAKITNERTVHYTDLQHDLVGGELELTRSIAERAFVAGLLGHEERIDSHELTDTDVDILTEHLENDYDGAPESTKKHEKQHYFIAVHTRKELGALAAYWHLQGSMARLSEESEEREQERHTEAALLSSTTTPLRRTS